MTTETERTEVQVKPLNIDASVLQRNTRQYLATGRRFVRTQRSGILYDRDLAGVPFLMITQPMTRWRKDYTAADGSVIPGHDVAEVWVQEFSDGLQKPKLWEVGGRYIQNTLRDMTETERVAHVLWTLARPSPAEAEAMGIKPLPRVLEVRRADGHIERKRQYPLMLAVYDGERDVAEIVDEEPSDIWGGGNGHTFRRSEPDFIDEVRESPMPEHVIARRIAEIKERGPVAASEAPWDDEDFLPSSPPFPPESVPPRRGPGRPRKGQ